MSHSKKSSCPIAIIGLGAVMPDAADAATFWKNICEGHDSIGEVPTNRWDPALHYDSDPKTPNRSYTKIGAFISDYKFNPLQFRIPPRVAESMDDVQKWAVEASSEALRDSGYEQKNFDRERCAVIIGNALAGEFHYMSTLRVYLPMFAQALRDTEQYQALGPGAQKALDAQFEQTAGLNLPEINEDTMPGELSNVIAGRVAQILNLRGSNYTTDAACASSLAALQSAAAGLAEMRFDMVLTGGVDSSLGPPSFVKFSKIGALSASLSCPFDERADGFVMGEGCGILLLKRLEDAERDGDKIYAVLRGIGSSSDGKGKGITAPNPHGQRLAIQRAYEAAGISPAEVGMIEAHGTSTAVGDVVEANTTAEFFSSAGVRPHQIPMGSVKSQIGHMKGAAGAAAMLKAALCIHHKTIPATLHFEKPNPKIDFENAPFYIPTRLQGWESQGPRVAGVSSFGFGGSNFHAVLSEHQTIRAETGPGTGQGQPEKSDTGGILSLGAEDADGLRQQLDDGVPLPGITSSAPHRLSIAFENESQRRRRLRLARTAIDKDEPATWKALSAQGIHRGQGPAGKTAFMFPGQGSQYINMLKTLKDEEPVVAETFAEADRIMAPILGRSLSEAIFTQDSPEARKALQDTTICQPAMLTADLAIARLLKQKGIHPDMVTGHSLGEYAALVAASVLSLKDALLAVSARAKEMVGVRVDDPGKMAAVFMPADELMRRIQDIEGVVPANFNSASQTVLAGASAPMDAAVARLTAAGVKAVMLDVSHAFHSPIVALAKEPLRRVLDGFNFSSPRIPVLANLDALPYDTDPQARTANIDRLAQQVASPVRWVESVRKLYAMGARFFVEVGPKKILTHFVNDILDDPTVIAVHTNHPKQNDNECINSCLAAAFAAGQNLNAEKPNQPISLKAPDASLSPALHHPSSRNLASRIGSFGKESTRAAAERPSGREHRPEEADAVQTGRSAMPTRGQHDQVVVAGVSLGLPGLDRDLFADDNTKRILAGYAGIDPVEEGMRQDLAKQHVVRLFKDAPGGPAFGVIEDPEQVAQLAGQMGRFDLEQEFGIPAERVASYDITTKLAIAAGLLALRDAGIPLLMGSKATSTGGRLPTGWRLPASLADETGIIFASAFPGTDQLVQEMNKRQRDESLRASLAELKRIVEQVGPLHAVQKRIQILEAELGKGYQLERDTIFRVLSLGHAQLAELIGARGPNIQMNAACASTTMAVNMAHDWIAQDRCRRVLVVGADDITNPALAPWLVGGLLATGALSTEKELSLAALPFDRRRNGMIPGMGAVGLVVETEESVKSRGMHALTRLLGSEIANSAFHGTRLDTEHIAGVMTRFIDRMEKEHGLDRATLARQTVFVSHETYTPARGGSASAEVAALRKAFGEHAEHIVIANTKGFTGHAMAAGIEDAAAVRMLQHQQVPPIANHQETDPELGQLNLSKGGHHPVRYALRLAAGFGSQLALSLSEGITVGTERVSDTQQQQRWFKDISGLQNPRLVVENKTLHLVEDSLGAEEPAFIRKTVEVASVPKKESRPVEQAPSSISASAETMPHAEPEAVEQASIEDVTERILAIVAEKTGYPVDMLEPDLDLEADLGIDTVKQAEMFAEIRATFGIPKQDDLKLADYPTLAHIIRFASEGSDSLTPVHEDASVNEPEVVEQASHENVTEQILTIVAEKTGYPVDMLEPDLDLEADLGIDTVKQAEMFAEIRAAFGIPKQDDLKLADYPTLAHIIRFAEEGASQEDPEPEPPAPSGTDGPQAPSRDGGLRFRQAQLVGLPGPSACAPSGARLKGRIFIAGGPMTSRIALAKELRSLGAQTVVIEAIEPSVAAEEAQSQARVASPDGLIILAPEGEALALDEEQDATWQAGLDTRLRLHFHLAKALHENLSDREGAFFACTTRMGGHLGLGPDGPADPAAGLSSGFAKALKREWGQSLVKVLDLPADLDAATQATWIAEELAIDPELVELGRTTAGRWAVRLRDEDSQTISTTHGLPQNPVVLITGGSGGIAAQVGADLARHHGGDYYLVARTPLPQSENDEMRLFRSDPKALKPKVLSRMKTEQEKITPAMVETEIQRVERACAAFDASETIRRAGGRAHHVALDIRDKEAVAALVKRIQQTHGRLDLIVHAAGIDHSRPLPSKTLEDFNSIVAVKAEGLRSLLRATRELGPCRMVLFGSIAGRFGNMAQTDYSAANDMLAKAALAMPRLRPQMTCLTLDYSAWAEVGMASRGSIPQAMAAAGIGTIPLSEGASSLRHALTQGMHGEWLVATELGVMEEQLQSQRMDPARIQAALSSDKERYVMLQRVSGWSLDEGLRLQVRFDPKQEPYLNDHRIENTAVVPGVMAVECFAEAVQLVHGSTGLISVEDLKFEAPLKLYRDEAREATLKLLPVLGPAGREYELSMETRRELTGGREQITCHYRARVRIEDVHQAASHLNPPLRRDHGHEAIDKASIYRAYFHGPGFQVLEQAGDDGATGLMGELDSKRLQPVMGRPAQLSSWPMLTELAFQTAGLLEAKTENHLGLPSSVRRLRIHPAQPDTARPILAHVTRNGHGYSAQVQDAQGQILVELEGYETSALPWPLPEDVQAGLKHNN